MWLRVPLIAFLSFITAAQDKELALGAALASEFRKHSTMVTDGRPEAIVRKIAGDSSGFTSWRVEVVAEDLGGSTHEPAVFRGGYLFVPQALLTAARGEAELAAMLAHAMAHVMERHGLQRGAGIPVYVGAGDVIPVGLLPQQRKLESEADRRAIVLLAAAGYDPAALRTYIHREQSDAGNGLFSRWPVREVRLSAIDAAITIAGARRP